MPLIGFCCPQLLQHSFYPGYASDNMFIILVPCSLKLPFLSLCKDTGATAATLGIGIPDVLWTAKGKEINYTRTSLQNTYFVTINYNNIFYLLFIAYVLHILTCMRINILLVILYSIPDIYGLFGGLIYRGYFGPIDVFF